MVLPPAGAPSRAATVPPPPPPPALGLFGRAAAPAAAAAAADDGALAFWRPRAAPTAVAGKLCLLLLGALIYGLSASILEASFALDSALAARAHVAAAQEASRAASAAGIEGAATSRWAGAAGERAARSRWAGAADFLGFASPPAASQSPFHSQSLAAELVPPPSPPPPPPPPRVSPWALGLPDERASPFFRPSNGRELALLTLSCVIFAAGAAQAMLPSAREAASVAVEALRLAPCIAATLYAPAVLTICWNGVTTVASCVRSFGGSPSCSASSVGVVATLTDPSNVFVGAAFVLLYWNSVYFGPRLRLTDLWELTSALRSTTIPGKE